MSMRTLEILLKLEDIAVGAKGSDAAALLLTAEWVEKLEKEYTSFIVDLDRQLTIARKEIVANSAQRSRLLQERLEMQLEILELRGKLAATDKRLTLMSLFGGR